MESVTESIVVQLQDKKKKKRQVSSSESEESENPIVEFTAVSPPKTKAQ
jgi:hypothetical protein